jgi:hypothetical protein
VAPILFVLASLLFTFPLSAGWGEEHLEKIRGLRLDPDQCYRVRDIFLEREDLKFYFVDGHLIFGQPVAGRTVAALFVASEPTDGGEIILFPPSKRERQSLSRFTGQPVLNEKFRTAMLFFTDDTAEALRSALQKNEYNQLDAEAGRRLPERWDPVMKNLLRSVELAVLSDAVSGRDPQSGFFGAVISGGTLGRFEVVIDPHRDEQVSVGQLVWSDSRDYYEAWCRFQGRNFAQGRRTKRKDEARLENYRIESHLDQDLGMKVVAQATFLPITANTKVFAFELSRRLRLTKVLLDGEPVEVLNSGGHTLADTPLRRNNIVGIAVPDPPVPGSRHEIEFHYEGRVIGDAGGGVYYVGSRESWYPRRGNGFTSFDLRFHYPEQLDLVATGKLVETTSGEGTRSSHFHTETPIRLAGFNLGVYKRVTRKFGDYTVEVCANQGVERSLKPLAKPDVVAVAPIGVPRRRRDPFREFPSTPTVLIESKLPPPPEPTLRLNAVADLSAQAFEFFVERFGPPATREIVISPIPGESGQGFPGLVYAPTLSYLDPDEPPLRDMPASDRLFYIQLLPAHEIAHQWWGNVVTVSTSSDVWLMEALATYSALMWLEDHSGPVARDEVLLQYKDLLLELNEDGEPVESAGAIVLGDRLRSSKFPNARNVIVYEKGGWILHMLRGILGDENFLALLRGIRDNYQFKSLSTEDFRSEAARFVPQDWPDPQLENFFDQWVYDTGIPTLSVQYHAEGTPPRVRFSGRLIQQNVPESFTLMAPVEIHTIPGRSLYKWIEAQGESTEFDVVLRNQPTRVELDPKNVVLAVKRD